ncbi:MAG TPA: efflux RND transporter periplasmic adaptor subunit [Gemmatimonadales bacterium]|nr:efflux RND transporter periplasmic adaptor subunit [Gemmatimonadales bacterium]
MIRSTLVRGRPLLALLLIVACAKKSTPPPPTFPVSVAQVRRADVPVTLAATGTVEPIRTASVQSQVNGLLMHVRFREGDDVKEGQILFEIDPRAFQATLDQAQANVARDQASWESAQRDVQRDTVLVAKEYVTQQQLDQARATANALAGTIRGDSAAIEQARLNLQFATIRAPITGRAGSVLVREGNQVRAGADQTLVVINQISPILVRFPVPATSFDDVRRRAEDRTLQVTAAPIADSTRTERGSLVFLDNAVDSLTSTVALKANFPNDDHALWPGALERVLLQLSVEKDALVVPAAAVQSGQAGDVIWTVDSAHKAHVVKVKVLRNTDSVDVVQGNVTPGQSVVTDGQLRLTDGAKVAVRAPSQVGDQGVVGPDTSKVQGVGDSTRPDTSGGRRGHKP